jgi:hypothetical protein
MMRTQYPCELVGFSTEEMYSNSAVKVTYFLLLKPNVDKHFYA